MVKRARLKRGVSARKKRRLSSFQRDLQATKQAYADCVMKPPKGVSWGSSKWWDWWKRVSEVRNLDWKGTEFYSPKQWLKLAKVVGRYNDFDPERVYKLLADLPVKVKLARESSVAVYVSGDSDTLKKLAERFKGYADEIDFVAVPYSYVHRGVKGVISKGGRSKYLRLWFD